MAQATITKTDGVNGEKSLTGIIYFGQEAKDNLAKGWTLYFKNEVYMNHYLQQERSGQHCKFHRCA